MEILNKIKEKPVKYGLTISSLILSIVTLIIYLATGIIRNFTEEYSISAIIFLIIGILANVIIIFKEIHLVNTIPFTAYIISLILFFVVNANYLVAVVREIDVTNVSISFILTIIFYVLSIGLSIASVCINKK